VSEVETARQAAAGAGIPTREELVERAASLVPTLRERAPTTEELRRIPDETLQEFRDAGFLRMAVPERFGGYGYGLATVTDVTQQIGRACGSSAWMCSFWATHQWMIGWFTEEAQAEYWADGPDTASSTASALVAWESEPVEGGLKATGAQRFSSGIDHAEWLILHSPNETCLVPRSDFRIEDDWYVSGLKGTGSKTVRYENIFVPEHRIVTNDQFASGEYPGKYVYPDDPMYQVPNPPGFVLPHMILAAVMATAGGFVELYDQRVRKRRDPNSMEPAMERQVVQHRFAESTVELDVARMLQARNLEEILENPSLPLLDRARIRRNTTYAAQLSERCVERLVSTGDSSGLYEVNDLHRFARDVRAGVLQFALMWDEMAVQYSRVRWGLEPHTFLI
jgi:alkylation response protein AidB-like acyl-CoA dehydrogenase